MFGKFLCQSFFTSTGLASASLAYSWHPTEKICVRKTKFYSTNNNDLMEFARENLPPFSEVEALVLCHVVGGSRITARGMSHLWKDVSLELEGTVREDINIPDFIARLKTLTPDQCMAIADAVDQFWKGTYYQDASTARKKLRHVGLLQEQ